MAHTIKYVNDMVGNNLKLYTFVDIHDVERIYTKLNNKAHFEPVHVMLYTLPGIPSLYYGSEFGIEGRKERNSDDSLRPALNYDDYKDAVHTNPCTQLIATLGKLRQNIKALCYGDYKQLELQNTYFAYARILDGDYVITTVNNGDNEVYMNIEAGTERASDHSGKTPNYVGVLTGRRVSVNDGRIQVSVPANSGEVWIPEALMSEGLAPLKTEESTESFTDSVVIDWFKSYEDMTVAELQEAILEKMRSNGPVTDYMLKTVRENTHHDSLVNWVKSFR